MTIGKLHEIAGARSSRVRTFVARPAEQEGVDEVVITFVRLSQTSVDEIAALPGVEIANESRQI